MLSSLRASFLYHRASSRLLIAARASLALQHSASLATRPGAARRPTRPSPPPTPPPSPEPQRASLPACTSGRPRAAVPSPASSLAQPRALSAESCRSSLVNRPGHFPYRVLGHEIQLVEVDVSEGVSIKAESGSMVYMTEGVKMDSSIGPVLNLALTGQNLTVCTFSFDKHPEGREQPLAQNHGTVGLASNVPSKIIPLVLADHGGELVCQKGAFICGAADTTIELAGVNMMAGFVGGEGFILQKLVGEGLVLIQANGAVLCRDLAPGETLRMSRGCLVAYEQTVSFDVQLVKGLGNMAFSGQGLFLTTLTGPGRVWLQSAPFDRFVAAIAKDLPGTGMGFGVPLVVGGGSSQGGGGGTNETSTTPNQGAMADESVSSSSSMARDDYDVQPLDENPEEESVKPRSWFRTLFADDDDDDDDDYDS